MAQPGDPKPFELDLGGRALAGEELGEGPPVVLAHGLTATRRYVVHGSKVLPREGYRIVSYDARGHGASDPAPEGGGYSYEELAEDLQAVLDEHAASAKPVIVGHSMGAHTAAALALERRDKLAAAVFVGPVFLGVAYEQDVLAEWDSLADGLERGGVEGFLEAYGSRDLDPEWRDVLLRISKERIAQHRHPDAVAEALREVPRSLPFDGLSELQFLEIPVLVVASHDIADPGHPYAIAEAWAESLPDARLVSEAEGDSPLAWQGGRLSREIAAFLAEPSVSERVQG